MSEAPNYAGTEVLSLFKGVMVVPAHKPTMREIASLVAERHGLVLEDFKGPSRDRRIAHPRQEAMSLCRDAGLWSYPQIGAFFGGRDHTTAMHGEKAHKARVAAAMALAAE